MSKSVFEKVLGDISVVADQVSINAMKESVTFAGKSDVGGANIQLDKNGADILELEVKEEAKASYNIDYLMSISKALGSIAETVTLHFSNKKPLRLEWKLNEQGAVVTYYLAPRIADN
jgi:proliferating cell nuclear antigen PCNA